MNIVKNEGGLYEVDVDGRLYAFQKWGAEKALDTLLDIMQFVGKPLSLLANAVIKDGVKADIKPDMVGIIMDCLLSGMGQNKQTIMAIIKRVTCERVSCNHQNFLFDTHFQDDLPHMFKVVRAGLDVQYGNFFSAVLNMGGIKRKDLQALAS